jgi:hypothetical protein
VSAGARPATTEPRILRMSAVRMAASRRASREQTRDRRQRPNPGDQFVAHSRVYNRENACPSPPGRQRCILRLGQILALSTSCKSTPFHSGGRRHRQDGVVIARSRDPHPVGLCSWDSSPLYRQDSRPHGTPDT